MAELVILGSGSGYATRDRFSTSIALLVEQSLYLLDCGEPCTTLLFRNGIDPLALRALFISHMHADHMGGLTSLLFSIYLAARSGGRKYRPWSVNRNDAWYRAALTFPDRGPAGGPVPETRPQIAVRLPSEGLAATQAFLDAVYLMPSILPFDFDMQPVQKGTTYADELIRATAIPNTHHTGNFVYENLPVQYPHVKLQSYSFAIDLQGYKMVYSGDITSPDELDPLLEGAQLLVIEMAHHDPDAFGAFLKHTPIPQIVLTHIHPGLETRLQELVRAWADPRVTVAYDGFRLPLARASEAA